MTVYPQQNGENMVSKFQILFNALEMAMESEEGNTYGGFLSHRGTQTIRPNYGYGIETAMVTWGSSWIFHFVKNPGLYHRYSNGNLQKDRNVINIHYIRLRKVTVPI